MILNVALDNSLKMLDVVLPWIIVVFGISFSIFLFATAIYSFVYYQKKANLKKSKEIIEENRQIVEDATFFKYNQKYQEIINQQINDIKENSKMVKSLQANIDELEDEKKRKKKKA